MHAGPHFPALAICDRYRFSRGFVIPPSAIICIFMFLRTLYWAGIPSLPYLAPVLFSFHQWMGITRSGLHGLSVIRLVVLVS